MVKKYFSSKIPHSVWMYLPLVTRETVASCTPISLAMSFRVRGTRYFGPRRKKSRWNSMIALQTLSRVSLRCWMLRMNQRASCSLWLTNWRTLLLPGGVLVLQPGR